MDDDEISCEVPPTAVSGRFADTTYCQILIDMMRLSSTAKKRLSSARALRQTAEQLVETVRDLNQKLDELRNCHSLQKLLLDSPLESGNLPEGWTLRQAQSLQYHYFSLVLDINTPLAHPWSGICAYARRDISAFTQLEMSRNAVAQASRAAILSTRQIRVDTSCPAL